MDDPDWYAVLGVGRSASDAQIARAFRRLAFRWHPDRNLTQPELAHRQFLLVHRAWEVLSDPAQRRTWDRAHAAAEETRPVADAPRAKPRHERAARNEDGAPAAAVVTRALSRSAWLVLSALIRVVGGVVMLLLGPLAERGARDELRRRAPALSDWVFPIGRLLLVGGIALLVVQRAFGLGGGARAAVLLILAGVVGFVLERVAIASVWAFGRRGPPRG
jgi:hypothetical protein